MSDSNTTAESSLSRYLEGFFTLKRESWLGLALVLPGVFLVAFIILYPTVTGIWTSFFEKSYLYPNQTEWVGLQNYKDLFSDPIFWTSLWHSVMLTASAVTLEYLFGLGLALALKRKVPGIQLFRSVTMVTWVLPVIVMVTIFNFMFQTDFGVINIVLGQLGLPTRYWFGSPDLAMPLVIFMHVWRNAPFFAIALMASMMAIPDELYEAARMDGASALQQFRYITMPNIAYTSMIMIVLHVLYTFNNFDIIYLSTGGGPLNKTEVLATYVYKQAFFQNMLGYGAAIGVVMLLIMSAFTIVYVRLEETE